MRYAYQIRWIDLEGNYCNDVVSLSDNYTLADVAAEWEDRPDCAIVYSVAIIKPSVRDLVPQKDWIHTWYQESYRRNNRYKELYEDYPDPEDMTEEEWEKYCYEHGIDPEDAVDFGFNTIPNILVDRTDYTRKI